MNEYEILSELAGMVCDAGTKASVDVDVIADAHDAMSFGAFAWTNDTVSVTVEDPESKDLQLVMLDANGCIVGKMGMSNLDLSFAAGAIVRYLGLL